RACLTGSIPSLARLSRGRGRRFWGSHIIAAPARSLNPEPSEVPVKTYQTDHIRNIVLVGHGHAGKTMLTEALLFAAGVTTRMGKIEEGNTVSDFDPDEISKQISISLALAPCEWKDHKINRIDAPGYGDFFGDAEAAMRAAD